MAGLIQAHLGEIMKTAAKAIASITIGALLAPYLMWCWAKIAVSGLFLDPIIRSGLRGNTMHAALAPLDFVATVILVLPAAWALWRLGKERIAMHVILALGALFATSTALFGPPSISFDLWPTLSTMLFYAALPVAVWLLVRFHRRAPGNSFKPNPLRG